MEIIIRYLQKVRILKTGETGEYTGEIMALLSNPPINQYKIIVNNEIKWLREKEFRALNDIRKNGK